MLCLDPSLIPRIHVKKKLFTEVHTCNASLHRQTQIDPRSLVSGTIPETVLLPLTYTYLHAHACIDPHPPIPKREQIGFSLGTKAVKITLRNLPCFTPSFFFQ